MSSRADKIAQREAGRVGVGENAGGECAQPSIALAGWMCFARRRGDERPHAAFRLDDAGVFELGVDSRDRIGVDAQVHGELTDRRQLVARLQPAVAIAARSPR